MSQLVDRSRTELLKVQQSVNPVRVRDLDFSDIYLNEMGLAEIQGSSQAALVQVPINAVFDLSGLMVKAFHLAASASSFSLEYDGVRYRGSRISNVNKRDGKTVVLRRLKDKVPRLNEIDLPAPTVRTLGYMARRTGGRGEGLILVCGPTGSGKTTTVSSILQEYLLVYGGIARTIEDPPEYPLEGSYPPHGRCWQTEVVNNDFFTPLKEVLRNAPRYILFGEIRDHKSAGDLLRAAQTGHLVLATIHAANIPEALMALVQLVASDMKMEFAQALLAASLAGVISQRLILHRDGAGHAEKVLQSEALFFKSSTGGENSLVRSGNFHQLMNVIDAQNALINANQMPFKVDSKR